MVGTIFKYLSSTNLSVRLFFGQRLLVRCVKNIHSLNHPVCSVNVLSSSEETN